MKMFIVLLLFHIKSENCYSFGQNCIKCNKEKCIEWTNENFDENKAIILEDDQCSNLCNTRTCFQCKEKNSTFCYQCSDNLAFDINEESKTFGECVACPKECSGCREPVNGKCNSCNSGYGLMEKYSSQCVQCEDPNCEYCYDDFRICTSCYDGYGITSTLNGGKSCVVCEDSRCIRCNTQAEVCFQCIEGYVFYAGECAKCPENCDSCENRNGLKCVVCKDGYGLNQKGECEKCSLSNCLDCSEDYTKCQECQVGYSYDNSICKKCSDDKCVNCKDDSNYCDKCIEGYGMDHDLKCVKCNQTNCLDCSLYYICTKCKEGYFNYLYTCHKCLDENCDECYTQSKECIKCKPGYTLGKDRECVPCSIKNCKDCEENRCICQKCMDGYGFDDKANSNTFRQCIKCSVDNCATCDTYGTCRKCMKNYNLNKKDNICIRDPNAPDDKNGDDDKNKGKLSKTVIIIIVVACVVVVLIVIIVVAVLCIKKKKVSNSSNSP